MSNSNVLARHRFLLWRFIEDVKEVYQSKNSDEISGEVIGSVVNKRYFKDKDESEMKKLINLENLIVKGGFSQSDIDNQYKYSESSKKSYSYIRAIRTYLQDRGIDDRIDKDKKRDKKIGLDYLQVLEIIQAIFAPRFKPEGYTYLKATQTFLREYQIDLENAQAEWRAYFENRFRSPIGRFFRIILPRPENTVSNLITLNIGFWSFLGNRVLSVYRAHINIAEGEKVKWINNKGREKEINIYKGREKAFTGLKRVVGKYSFISETVSNNVQKIFHFDRSLKESMEMVIYEIDPDVDRGSGRGISKYFGKCTIKNTWREKTLLWSEKNKEEDNSQSKAKQDTEDELLKAIEKISNIDQRYQFARVYNNKDDRDSKHPEWEKIKEEEKEYQYSIIRFLIRSGIFNPREAYDKEALNNKIDLLENCRERRIINACEEQYDSSLDKYITSSEDFGRSGLPAFEHKEKYANSDENASKPNDDLDEVIAYIEDVDSNALNIRLATFEAGFFDLTHQDNTIEHIYWLPVVTNSRKQSVGGTAYINTNTLITDDIEGDQGNKIEPGDEAPQKLITILYYLTGQVDDKQIEEIEEDIRPAVERAAAVSIISRNISHNIASHVLSYLKNLLSNEQKMLDNKILDNIIDQVSKGVWQINEDIIDNNTLMLKPEDMLLPYLRSLGKLLGYFQERQDYVGVLASGWQLYYGTVHFKEAIYDYFVGGEKVKSISTNFEDTSSNIILDYIAYSEGFARKHIDFEIYQYFPDRKEPLKKFAKKLHDGSIEEGIGDLEMALPAGITGRQGIFTILENFIRNSAKHGKTRLEGKELEGREKMLIKISISDEESGNYYRIKLTGNGGNGDNEVKKRIDKALKASLVKLDGSVDEQHKGIKEMQIAAAWLRGIRPDEIKEAEEEYLKINDLRLKRKEVEKLDKKKKNDGLTDVEKQQLDDYTTEIILADCELKTKYDNLRILDVESVAGDTGDNLEYTFYLRKPKNVLLIVDDADNYRTRFSHLSDWDIVEFDSNVNENKIPYQMVAIHKDLKSEPANIDIDEKEKYEEKIKKYRNRLKWIKEHAPVRLLEGVASEDLTGKSSDEIENRLLANWMDKKLTFGWTNLPADPSKIDIGISDSSFGYTIIENGKTHIKDYYDKRTEEKPILFRHHNDTKKKFEAFEKIGNSNIFLEGISGGNSTGRLIRGESEKTIEWSLKIRESALTKILIVDERLWKDYRDEEKNRYFYAKMLHRKNIFIYNLELDADGNMVFWDLLEEPADTENGGALRKLADTGTFEKPVAVLRKNGTIERLSGSELSESDFEFHFISLHQGLIDRMDRYCTDIDRKKLEKKEEAYKRKEIANTLFTQFKTGFKANCRYLIHSGRSKTPMLPAETAFIQYSSIGNALNDCKFTLTELLYSSIIEEAAMEEDKDEQNGK